MTFPVPAWCVTVREGVDWAHVEFDFWPMKHGEDENAEPDLVLVSNRWLLVVEVKLDSGLGHRQPWREYVVGQQFARERNLSGACVRYVVVARDRMDLASTFLPNEAHQRDDLLARSFHMRWSDVVATVESWLRHGAGRGQLIDEQIRILDDLLQVMRRRRNIAFEGFAFTNQHDVRSTNRRLFCPPSFEGFPMRRLRSVAVGSVGFLSALMALENTSLLSERCDALLGRCQSSLVLCTRPSVAVRKAR